MCSAVLPVRHNSPISPFLFFCPINTAEKSVSDQSSWEIHLLRDNWPGQPPSCCKWERAAHIKEWPYGTVLNKNSRWSCVRSKQYFALLSPSIDSSLTGSNQEGSCGKLSSLLKCMTGLRQNGQFNTEAQGYKLERWYRKWSEYWVL